MANRHEALGIKQVIRVEWMQKAADLLLARLDAKTIRHELHDFLANKKGDGSEGRRSDNTRTFIVNNLMKIWISPAPELIPLRDISLNFLRETPSMALAIHWGMISAAYPFWFNVAQQTGRLLALQDQVTHAQITNRIKEQYGDRQTVARYSRFVLRSFVAWNATRDSNSNGCYENSTPIVIVDRTLVSIMFESALLATPRERVALGLLCNNPAFFPFQLPSVTGNIIVQQNDRIELVYHGLDDELLGLHQTSK